MPEQGKTEQADDGQQHQPKGTVWQQVRAGRLPFSTFSSLSLSSLFFIKLQRVKKLYSPTPTNSISFFFRRVSSLIIDDNRQPERIFTSSCGCPSPWGLFYSTSGF
jgi:hypothetical protein